MSSSRTQVRWLGAALACILAGLLAAVWGGSAATPATDHVQSFEALSEAVLAVCLFTAGLKLSGPLDWGTWRVPLALAFVTLPVTIALAAGVANVFLGLPMEQALLLGAILGPTDPVLAWNIELPSSRAQATRFALAAEGALGSCLALPLVLFALGLNGYHDLGPFASRWIGFDVAWGLGGGGACGWLVGALAARGLKRVGSRGSIGLAELAGLAGTLVLACGAAFLLDANEFAAALAAGAAIARAAVRPPHAVSAPRRAQALASTAARVERIAELGFLAALGALLAVARVHTALVLYALLILIGVRPLAAGLAFHTPSPDGPERRIVAWFGVRGVASMYYLMLAVDQSASAPAATRLVAATVSVLAISIALHALTALPLGKRPAGERG
jgi:sodium/hydrogen antiporter